MRRGTRGQGIVGRFPPGPPHRIPWLGSGFGVAADPLARFVDWSARYGDVAHYTLAGTDFFLLSHPEDIAEVLVGKHQRFMKDGITHELSRIIGRGLVTSEGDFWRRQRKLAAPSFTRRHIQRFADTMVDRTFPWIDAIFDDQFDDQFDGERERRTCDVHHAMMGLTLDVVLHTLFGDAAVPDFGRVDEVVTTIMEEFHRRYLSWRRLLPDTWVPQSERRLAWARAELDRMIYGIIAGRRTSGVERDDLLGRFLQARDDEGRAMNDRQLRDEVATIFLAGHETTALTLSYSLLLLARDPERQAKLRAEVERVVGGRRVSLEDVSAMPYLEAVVTESMRIYPPVWGIGREPLEDCEIAGWHVPRRSQIILPQWVVHHDARWFQDPDAFVPERWLDGLADRLPRFAYFPFGGGPRICVGNHFSLLEAKLVLATLMQEVEVRPKPDYELRFLPSVTLRPRGGVPLEVVRLRGVRSR